VSRYLWNKLSSNYLTFIFNIYSWPTARYNCKIIGRKVRFRVLTAVRIKMTCLLECYAVKSVRNLLTFHSNLLPSIALKTEAVRTSETSVNFYQTTRRSIPEDVFSRHKIIK
jgi:hypothetical protein